MEKDVRNISEETIAAMATPPGEGGIGIIKLSGDRSLDIIESLFQGGRLNPRELSFGHIYDPEKKVAVDEVLVCYMPAPKTYTREDVVEINCHGGARSLSKVLSLCLKAGARMAEPGEFTKRAFLNGRIDLAQAEAVLDVINAKTEDSLEAAVNQLRGKFSEEVSEIQKKLTDILVDVGVNIDYPDEDIEEVTYEKLQTGLKDVLGDIRGLLESAKSGKILRDGLKVSIIGKPNAGKSTLLNLLLGEGRAIVTDIPGTTRDTIEEFCNIKGIPVKLTDTAGLRETTDKVESIGIERTMESIKDSDLVILILDRAGENASEEAEEILKMIEEENLDEYNMILLINKCDRPSTLEPQLIEEIKKKNFGKVIETSLLERKDLPKIEEAIFSLSGYAPEEEEESACKSEGQSARVEEGSTEGLAEGNRPASGRRAASIVTNTRHVTMLESASQNIEDALSAAAGGAALELVEIDIREAYENLGFISGDSVQDDIINEIFSRFCLGK